MRVISFWLMTAALLAAGAAGLHLTLEADSELPHSILSDLPEAPDGLTVTITGDGRESQTFVGGTFDPDIGVSRDGRLLTVTVMSDCPDGEACGRPGGGPAPGSPEHDDFLEARMWLGCALIVSVFTPDWRHVIRLDSHVRYCHVPQGQIRRHPLNKTSRVVRDGTQE